MESLAKLNSSWTGVVGDPAMDWYMRELGPGAMVREPKHFGSAYIRDTMSNDDLMFVSRKAIAE